MIFVESALGAGAFLYGNADGDGLLPAGEGDEAVGEKMPREQSGGG